MAKVMSLSAAKAKISEVVRTVRTLGQELVVTVDGESAVKIVPMPSEPTTLSEVEVLTYRALSASILRGPQRNEVFDAVALVGEGRR